MQLRFQRVLAALDLEDRILHCASIFALVSVFFPWISGEWLSEETISYSGFRFFTSFIGLAIFLLHITLLSFTIIPAFGGPVMMRRRRREFTRLCLSSQATILSLVALSVLAKVTYDYTRMDLRYGIYCTFIGSLIATFYAFLRWQQIRKLDEQTDSFHHPEDHTPAPVVEPQTRTFSAPPLPVPPAPSAPEDHPIHR